jgi:hypothetical protein
MSDGGELDELGTGADDAQDTHESIVDFLGARPAFAHL